jgi:YVTN family beta-propeller protein
MRSISIVPCLLALTFSSALGTQQLDDPEGDPIELSITLDPSAMRLIEQGGVNQTFQGEPSLAGSVGFLSTEEEPEGDTPTALAFTSDGATIVIAHRDSQNLVLFDAATRASTGVIDVTGSPNAMALTSDDALAVTANVFEDTVSIIDLGLGQEVAVIPVGDQPSVVRITPDDLLAVVGNTVDQTFSVIDLTTRTELRQIAGAGFTSTTTISFEPGVTTFKFVEFECVDNNTILHPDYANGTIDFFDLTTGAATSLTSAPQPYGIALTPDRTKAVVTHLFSNRTLTVIDTGAKTFSTIATTIDVQDDVTLDPAGTKAVVAVQNGCIVVNLGTSAISPVLSTASVNALRTTADGLYALVIGFRGSVISFASETVVDEVNNFVSAYVGGVSPSTSRAAMASQHNGEDLLVVNVAGAGSTLEGVVPTGPPKEGDKARMAAISPDGRWAITTNILSHTASVIDRTTGTLAGIVPVGLRPAEVAFTPDSSKAVVANLDSTFASVIARPALTVTSVGLSTRQSEVEISPNGQYAYVAVVVSDGVWRIDLNTLAVAGSRLPVGEMGSALLLFNQTSGMTLSPDGGTLVTCNSFHDTITVIDTASWSVTGTVNVGAFPIRARFSADGRRLFVSNRTGSSVSVLDENGGTWSLTATIPVGSWPFDMAVSSATDRLYVGNHLDDTLSVIDTAALSVLQTVALPEAPQGLFLDPIANQLAVACGTWSVTIGPGPKVQTDRSGDLALIDLATLGATSLSTGEPPGQIVADPCGGELFVPVPFIDGLQTHATDATSLRLSITPEVAALNDTVAITSCNGDPGFLATLFVTAIDGTPTFVRLPVTGTFNAAGVWRVAGPLSNSPGPLTLTVHTLALTASGGLAFSNPEELVLE